jgi:hypothetical protein
MLTFQKFTGINNVLPPERLVPERRTGATPLVIATNVDIGLDGELSRRSGYSEVLDTCHKNLWQADGFMLATVDGGDLVAIAPNGDRTTIYPSLGIARVWYCNLPDGRTTFSNGLICGITDGATMTTWGVPVPASAGAITDVAGNLFVGSYRYALTHVRLADGLEGPPLDTAPVTLTGGFVLDGLPVLAGHKINVYLTSHNDDTLYFAGATTNTMFAFTAANDTLVLPLRTDNLAVAPAPTVTAFWRGRALLAFGPVLYASRTNQWELFDFRRDFKQFSADITLIQPVDDGVWVGTTKELAFLAGTEFDKLSYERKVDGGVVLGSGVAVRGELVQQGEGAGQGAAMICIADGVITAGFSDGGVVRMTEGRYATTAVEVSATFRMIDRVPQYVAVPQ